MPRIAMLAHEFMPYPGGVARYCVELASAAVRLGADVTVFAPSTDLAGRSFDGGLPFTVETYANDPNFARPLPLVRLVRDIRRFLRGRTFDIIHVTDWPLVVPMAFVGTGDATRLLTIHGTDANLLANGRRQRLLGSRRAVRRFHRYAPNSRFTSGLLRSRFPAIPEAAVGVAPLGVSDFWREPATRDEIRRAHEKGHVAADRFTVVTLGRVDRRKGHALTARALAALPGELKARLDYVTIGRVVDDAVFAEVQSIAVEGGVTHRHLLGLSDGEVRAVLAASDLFALTAVRTSNTVEGFGLVLLEAASQGLPALVTAVDAIPEVVSPGETGWVVPPDDVEALTARIAEAMAGGGAALREACIRRAGTFTWEATARLTYGL